MTALATPGAPTAVPTTRRHGNVHAATDALRRAVAGLIDPLYERRFDGTTAAADSLYDQLGAAVGGAQLNPGGGTGGKSRPPIWIDARDLLTEIDTGVGAWNPYYCCEPATVCRLRGIANRHWEPDKLRNVRQLTGITTRWAEQIDQLLGHAHVKYVKAACPQCGNTTTLRKDSAGELIRVHVLQIVTDQGCRCVACGAQWLPAQYEFLSRVIDQMSDTKGTTTP